MEKNPVGWLSQARFDPCDKHHLPLVDSCSHLPSKETTCSVGAWRRMQGMGVEVGRLAWPAGATCCALNMQGMGWSYGGLVPCGINLFKWGLGKLFCASLTSDGGGWECALALWPEMRKTSNMIETMASRKRLNFKCDSDGSMLSSDHGQVDLPRDVVLMKEAFGMI